MSIVIPDELEATIYADCYSATNVATNGKEQTLVGPYTSRNIQSFGNIISSMKVRKAGAAQAENFKT